MPGQKILVAVAWPYTNGARHIGHVAGFGVPSDVFARYHRLRGNDVLMVSGTDEHGTPNLIMADREGLTPKETVDKYNAIIAKDLHDLGLTYDCFTRTTTRNHYRVAQDVFKTLYDKGYLVKKTAMGAFQAATGRTLPDRYIEGTCPICGFPDARGDQCDNCLNQLDPIDLISPRSKIDGTAPIFKETEHFYLDLPAFADALAKWISKREHWRPNVKNFSLNYIKDLKPRPVTRDIDWGVPIPLPDWENRPDKKMYVWFDAVIGYFSASRDIAIYVNDFLSRYDPDPLRYYLTIAGPETNDTDFTWAEFLRRNNGELVATWGNLVHRTLTNAHRHFGAVPDAGELRDDDRAVIAAVQAGFTGVGDAIEGARFRAGLAEAMRLAALVNQYLAVHEPWKIMSSDRGRAGTVLYTALRCIDDLKILLTPFLPFTCQRLHESLGYDGVIAGQPEFRTVAEDGAPHRVLTGDYTSWSGRWMPTDLGPGQKLREPRALFKKLDDSIVASELALMEERAKAAGSP